MNKVHFFFDILLIGLSPLLTFVTINDSFSMFTALPLTLLLLVRFCVVSYFSPLKLHRIRLSVSIALVIWLLFSLMINLCTYPEVITGKSFIRLFYIYSAIVFLLLASSRTYLKEELFLLFRLELFSATVISFAIIRAFLKGDSGKISLYSIFGVYVEENYTGALLAILLIIGIFVLKLDKRPYPVHYLEVWIVCFGIFLTGSRAAMLGSLCGGVTFFLMSKNKVNSHAAIGRTFCLLCAIALGIYLLYLYVPAWTWERMFLKSYADNSNLGRIQLWKNALQGFLAHPIYGWGIGNYGTFLYGKDVSIVAHNTYLTILVDGGIIYFLLMLSLIFLSLKWILLKRKPYVSLLVCYFIVTLIVDGGRMFFFWYGLLMIILIAECPDLMEAESKGVLKRYARRAFRISPRMGREVGNEHFSPGIS